MHDLRSVFNRILFYKNVVVAVILKKLPALQGFAKQLDIEKFQASDSWLQVSKTRYNISFKKVSGESRSVTPEMTNAWNETSLRTILSR